MVQFKDVFSAREKRRTTAPPPRSARLRAGGKHTTWKTSATPRATTPSSRCWQLSFGDYFKRDAYQFAWEQEEEIRCDSDDLLIPDRSPTARAMRERRGVA